MRPNSNGSSTIGMKKSVVATIACRSETCHTAASSAVSMPTRSSGGTASGVADRARASRSDSTAGAILQPQPPPCESDVRRGSTAASASFTSSASMSVSVRSRLGKATDVAGASPFVPCALPSNRPGRECP